MVDRLRAEYQDTIEFRLYDVDTDEEGRRIADELGAQYVPTFVFVNSDGTVLHMEAGALPEKRIREKLDALR